jgi:predicted negative regulator of RcsB-dependent stress response
VNGNFDLALKALDAISLDKENATVASLKGDALRGLGRLELAEAQYTKAIDLSQIAEERAVAEYKLKLISQ